MSPCPCGSGQPHATCCGPYLDGHSHPPTALALMRSRYSAFALARWDYLDASRAAIHQDASHRPAPNDVTPCWQKLEIHQLKDGGVNDDTGMVEFSAHFTLNGRPGVHRERSYFHREAGHWVYVDGVQLPAAGAGNQAARTKIGRNTPCPCGSGKKFKKCCGS